MTDAEDANRRRAARMARRKDPRDAEVASKTIATKGLPRVTAGPGKGKSTAAFGLVPRDAAAAGWRSGR
jgi:cob(I)alamin adenosyltransferase